MIRISQIDVNFPSGIDKFSVYVILEFVEFFVFQIKNNLN